MCNYSIQMPDEAVISIERHAKELGCSAEDFIQTCLAHILRNIDSADVDYSTFPCQYTEEEFDEVVKAAEEETPLSMSDTKHFYEKWGIAL